MERDSIANTFVVALGVCLVCATLVSVAAVGLRDMQQENKLKDKKKNILAVAGLLEENGGTDVDEIFNKRIADHIIDLATGEDVTSEYENPGTYDQIDAAESGKNALRKRLSSQEDIATIKDREYRSHVYIVKTSETDESPLMYVFPIRGKGLWSVLKGFIALDADLNTIQGITYYEHAETPGLGGEVDRQDWKDSWQGKRLFDTDGTVAMRLLKADAQDNPHAVDTLSGATITSRGVEYMLEFWMGADGFEPYLEKLRSSASALP